MIEKTGYRLLNERKKKRERLFAEHLSFTACDG
jgi:hypothetical protein